MIRCNGQHRETMASYYVYVLRCENGSLYTGYTTDIQRRYLAHLQGKCKYTRSFKPTEIAGSWELASKSQALQFEKAIKRLSKQEKESLLTYPYLDQFFNLQPNYKGESLKSIAAEEN
jgi:putative endonuclease